MPPRWRTGSTTAPFFRWIVDEAHLRVFRADLALSITWLAASVTPLCFYPLASKLLGDRKLGFVCAALLTFLPHHIRFSHSDVMFIPTLALAALAVAAAHDVLTTESRGWRVWSVGCLLFFLSLCLPLRPLNILFAVVLGGMPFVVSPRPNRAAVGWVLGPTLLVGGAVVALHLSTHHSGDVRQALGTETLIGAARVVVNPLLKTVTNPWFTPPLLVLLAIVGTARLTATGARRMALFLMGWFVLFLLPHGFVVPDAPQLQARYHLHLLPPFLLLLPRPSLRARRGVRRPCRRALSA